MQKLKNISKTSKNIAKRLPAGCLAVSRCLAGKESCRGPHGIHLGLVWGPSVSLVGPIQGPPGIHPGSNWGPSGSLAGSICGPSGLHPVLIRGPSVVHARPLPGSIRRSLGAAAVPENPLARKHSGILLYFLNPHSANVREIEKKNRFSEKHECEEVRPC